MSRPGCRWLTRKVRGAPGQYGLKMYGDRAFSQAARRLWIALPSDLRAVSSLNDSKLNVKT